MLKILQGRLQQYMNCELPDFNLVLEKAKEPEIKLPTSAGLLQRRLWHPALVLLPEKSHELRSLVGCSPWGREELDMTDRLHFHTLQKEMATHSSVLAWRIPGMGDHGGLPSMVTHRVGHD